MRLNEIAVAIGAPMNPKRIHDGPHTAVSLSTEVDMLYGSNSPSK